MQLLVVVCADIATGEHFFEVLEECRVDGHHVFVVAMDRAVLHHDDLAVLLEDGGFDLAHLLVEKDADVLLAVENRLTRFSRAVGAQRVGLAGPTERRLGFLIRLLEGFVRPARNERGVLLDLVGSRKYLPNAIRGDGQSLLDVLHRRMHAVVLPVLDAENPSFRALSFLRPVRTDQLGPQARVGNLDHPSGQTVKNQAISSELANPGVGWAVEGRGGRGDEWGKSQPQRRFVPLPLADQIKPSRSLYFPHTRQIGTMWRPC